MGEGNLIVKICPSNSVWHRTYSINIWWTNRWMHTYWKSLLTECWSESWQEMEDSFNQVNWGIFSKWPSDRERLEEVSRSQRTCGGSLQGPLPSPRPEKVRGKSQACQQETWQELRLRQGDTAERGFRRREWGPDCPTADTSVLLGCFWMQGNHNVKRKALFSVLYMHYQYQLQTNKT